MFMSSRSNESEESSATGRLLAWKVRSELQGTLCPISALSTSTTDKSYRATGATSRPTRASHPGSNRRFGALWRSSLWISHENRQELMQFLSLHLPSGSAIMLLISDKLPSCMDEQVTPVPHGDYNTVRRFVSFGLEV